MKVATVASVNVSVYLVDRAVTRAFIGGGGYIHIFMFYQTTFVSNQIVQCEKKSVGQHMNI